jgi:hypothetical protein
MLDRLNPSAEDTAKEWVGAFDAALAGGSEIALSELFVSDSHWRNLLGISWQFATFSGRRTLAREMLQRAATAGASGFRIDTTALTPRHVVVAGREIIEAVISFDTAEGPGIGAGQPGLWFTGGAFSQARIYSRFIALQISAIEAGRLSKRRDQSGPN